MKPSASTQPRGRRGNGGDVPAQPFIDWINDQLRRLAVGANPNGGGVCSPLVTLAEMMGTTERTVRRYQCGLKEKRKSGQTTARYVPTDTFSRDAVERMLNKAGVYLYELYPEIAKAEEPDELEPSEWCDCCGDFVTPIDGFCAFHPKQYVSTQWEQAA